MGRLKQGERPACRGTVITGQGPQLLTPIFGLTIVAINLSREAARRRDAADPLRTTEASSCFPRVWCISTEIRWARFRGRLLSASPKSSHLNGAKISYAAGMIHDWINSPLKLGAKLAGIIGAAEDEVVVTETTSINLFRLVLAALNCDLNARMW